MTRTKHEELARRAAMAQVYISDFLTSKGYPESAVVLEPALRGGARPDILIVDPATRQYLGVIELKVEPVNIDLERSPWIDQIKTFRFALGNETLPAFVVVVSENEEEGSTSLAFFRVSDNRLQAITSSEFPTFERLRNEVLAKSVQGTESRQVKTVKLLERSLAWLTVLAVELILLIFWRLWTPTWETLALLAGFVLMILLPHMQIVKVLGIELQRLGRD